MDDSTKGRHLIVTGFAGSEFSSRLDDPDHVATFLQEVVEAANMHVLMGPHVVRVPLEPGKACSDEDCGGVTGVVVLSTSHASIHTWPLHGRVSFDLYSCHDFDPDVVLQLLIDRLGVRGGEILNIDRTPNRALRNDLVSKTF